jgi:hypothetical protein
MFVRVRLSLRVSECPHMYPVYCVVPVRFGLSGRVVLVCLTVHFGLPIHTLWFACPCGCLCVCVCVCVHNS